MGSNLRGSWRLKLYNWTARRFKNKKRKKGGGWWVLGDGLKKKKRMSRQTHISISADPGFSHTVLYYLLSLIFTIVEKLWCYSTGYLCIFVIIQWYSLTIEVRKGKVALFWLHIIQWLPWCTANPCFDAYLSNCTLVNALLPNIFSKLRCKNLHQHFYHPFGCLIPLI